MPERVTGYLISDGRFFADKRIAAYEDSKLELDIQASRSINITSSYFEDFLLFIETNAALVTKHCQNTIALTNVSSADDDANEDVKQLKAMQDGEDIGVNHPPLMAQLMQKSGVLKDEKPPTGKDQSQTKNENSSNNKRS